MQLQTAPAPSPATRRNRFLDAFRAVALVRILVWHTYGYAWLSYLIASMPAMFFVAGSLMSRSLSRRGAADVLYSRFRRLLVPFWVFAICALALMTFQAGAILALHHLVWWVVPFWDPTGTEWGLTLTVPLWYLRCLTWLILLSPLLLWFWRRLGPLILPLPLAALVLIEAGQLGTVPWQFKDISLFSFFWLLGFAYDDGEFGRLSSRQRAAIAAGCVVAAAFWLITQDVPASIVNLSYPMHLFVGCAWLFAALAFEAPISRVASLPRLRNVIDWLNSRALTIYLWQTAGLLVMYQVLWTSDHPSWVRVVFALPIVLSVTFLATLLFGWIEDFAGRHGALQRPSLRVPAMTPRTAIAGVFGAAGIAAISIAIFSVAHDPSTLVQASANTVPPSGAGLHYRAQKAEIISGPPLRPLSGRTEPVTSSELQSELEAWISDWDLKGATVTVRRDTGESWTGASGFDNDEHAFYVDEPYWIASVTKTFTAALILRLAEEGYLALDDPVSKFVPDFPNADRFTIRQLLQHTSGLTSDSEEPNKALAEAAQQGLQFEPGTGYLYSRAGYYLLALVIEDVIGISYTDALHQLLLNPLQLSSTAMDEELFPTTVSTHPYSPENAGPEGESWTQGGLYLERNDAAWEYYGVLWSAGGIWSTTDDLTRWALALYDGSEVLSPASLEAMTTFLDAQFDYTGLGTYPFCTCWYTDGILHSERWGFAGTTGILEFDPEDRVALAVHMNGTLFDANVIDALEDLSVRFRGLIRGRAFDIEAPLAIPSLQLYLVEDGDTLFDIAQRLGIAEADQQRWVDDVRSLNDILDDDPIEIGSELRLP